MSFSRDPFRKHNTTNKRMKPKQAQAQGNEEYSMYSQMVHVLTIPLLNENYSTITVLLTALEA